MDIIPRCFRSPWLWLGICLVILYLRGLWLDIMDVDAAQYASISMEMLQNSQWLQVQHRAADYLDKPPLLFWLTAPSFALLGLNNAAYKLPSLLVALLGVWSTYRYTLLFYGRKTARHAAFLLASCMGLMVICNDVRTDTMLLGFATFAVWQLTEYLQREHWVNLMAGFAGIGLAMLAKGPIGLVMPAFAIGTHLLLRRDWEGLFRWQWLAGLVLVAAMLMPMCWGLWQQFDLHPEKWVNGRQGVSGLRFFFWEQSFGRITGENVWKNNTSAFYFLHVYLWAFLPWCLLLAWALWRHLHGLFSSSKPIENGALGGFLLTFAALSLSHYKLPHYIFITLPWAAVLTAVALHQNKVSKLIGALLYLALGAAWMVAAVVLFWAFPKGNWLTTAIASAAAFPLLWRVWQKPFPDDTETLVQRGVWGAAIFGLVLNFHFYPRLLPFQNASQTAREARSAQIPPEKMYFFNASSHALDFYNGRIMESLESPDLVAQKARELGWIAVYTTSDGKKTLEKSGLSFETVSVYPHFQVALLKPKFLNPTTRQETLAEYFLLKIQ